MPLVRKSIICLILLWLTSCAISGPGTECLAFEPIWLSPADQLTSDTGRQILKHNEKFISLCR